MSLSALFPELVALIADHVPLHYLPQTLLALALTSRHFYKIVVPHVLYRDVRVSGTEQPKCLLERFVEEVRGCEAGDIPRAHCVRRLLVEEKLEGEEPEEDDDEEGDEGDEEEVTQGIEDEEDDDEQSDEMDDRDNEDQGAEDAAETEHSETASVITTNAERSVPEVSAVDSSYVKADSEPNLLRLLHQLINIGGLPNIRSLGIDFSGYSSISTEILEICKDFWVHVRAQCRFLREVRLANLDGRDTDFAALPNFPVRTSLI